MPRFRLENKYKGVALLSLGVPQWIVRVLRGNTVLYWDSRQLTHDFLEKNSDDIQIVVSDWIFDATA
jgi:hypothetical protein